MRILELGALTVCLLILLLVLAQTADASDCTHDGKFSKSTCYGIQHAAIAAVVVGAMTAADPKMALPVAAGTCGVFILKELEGEGGLFKDSDRFWDWMAPCAVSYGIAAYWGDQSWLPWLSDDAAGVAYSMRFD